MTPTYDLETTLPLAAPGAAFPLVGPKLGIFYSVYTLVDLSSEDEESLLQQLNSNEFVGTETCRFAPTKHKQATLLDAYNDHLRSRDVEGSNIHPYIFIVLDQEMIPDNSSILVVYLKAPAQRSDVKLVVGVLRCKIDDAALIGCNLDNGNVGWIEYKESEEAKWGGESVYVNQRYFATDPREEERVTGPAKTKYAWFSLVRRALPIDTMLEPNWLDIPDNQRRFTMASNASRWEDPWKQIRQSFPEACWQSENIERRMLLVAERENADEEDAMSIYRVVWDAEKELGKLPAYRDDDPRMNRQSDLQDVRAIMPELEFLEKTRASRALGRLEELED